MDEAVISVLLKKDKNPLKCESYRLVSLLNSCYKILTKVLATRLDLVMHKIIHTDQSGFISGTQMSGNLQRLFNVLYSPHSPVTAEVLIALDAHKAFDRTEYDYLFMNLEKFEFGASFCSWIRTLYSSPKAVVRTNKILSQPFP